LAAEDTSLSGLAGRYALALIDLADEKKELDGVAEDLLGLKAAIAESEDLRRLVRSPVFSADNQTLALVAVLMVVFPISKLLHAPAVFFSPTRVQVDNPREQRHVARWAAELENK